MSFQNDPPLKKAARWCFADRETGRIVIVQAPNWPLWGFILASAVLILARPKGTVGTGLQVVATASLTIWAVDEIVRGVNPWRRGLGFAVVVFELVRWLRP